MVKHETDSQQLQAEIQALREELSFTRQSHETAVQQMLDLQTNIQQQLNECTSASKITIPPPDAFTAESDNIDDFIHCLDVYFYATNDFHSDDAKIRFACGLMKGKADYWTLPRIGPNPSKRMPTTYEEYCASVRKEFSSVNSRDFTFKRLMASMHSVAARNQAKRLRQTTTQL